MPERIEIVRHLAGTESKESIIFSELQRTKLSYPLPPGLASALVTQAQGANAEAKGLRQTLAAIAGTALPAKPSFGNVIDRIRSASNANNSIEATLSFSLLTQQYGGAIQSNTEFKARFQELIPLLRSQLQSPDAGKFMRASVLAGAAGAEPDRENAALYLANAKDLDALMFGTFRFVTFANLVQTSGNVSNWKKELWRKMPSLAECYWTHIGAYPWASNVFADLGSLLYRSFDTPKAWDAWDLGRAVDPEWRTGTMIATSQLEERLRAAMPDDF